MKDFIWTLIFAAIVLVSIPLDLFLSILKVEWPD